MRLCLLLCAVRIQALLSAFLDLSLCVCRLCCSLSHGEVIPGSTHALPCCETPPLQASSSRECLTLMTQTSVSSWVSSTEREDSTRIKAAEPPGVGRGENEWPKLAFSGCPERVGWAAAQQGGCWVGLLVSLQPPPLSPPRAPPLPVDSECQPER